MKPGDLLLTPMGLRFAGRLLPCTIGRGGLTTTKTEGDGATPIGTHRIIGLLYRPDRMPPPSPWACPISPRDLWCDDPADTRYNSRVQAPFAPGHEVLRRPDRLYDLILVTDWNMDAPRPGGGSAIFIHRWRWPGAATAGCIALHPAHLRWIARRVEPGARLIVR